MSRTGNQLLCWSSYKINTSSLVKQRITKSIWVRLVQSVKADDVDRTSVNKQTSVVIVLNYNSNIMITLTTIQLWIVNSRMISIHTHSTLTECCCTTLARSLSNKFNSEFKQIENLIRKQSKKRWRRAELQRELRKFKQNCESAKEWKSKVEANIQKQSGKSKVRIPVRAGLNG